jgi:hypothetical protein
MTERWRNGEPAARPDRTGRTLREADRATLARLAAHERWARVRDRSAATAAARAAADDRFIAEAGRFHAGLTEEEILKRARNLRSAHAVRAARARWHKTRWQGARRSQHCGLRHDRPSIVAAKPIGQPGIAMSPPRNPTNEDSTRLD